jgi:hypothetical protein
MPGTSGYNARTFKTKIMTTSIPGREIEPVEVGLHGATIDYAGRVLYTRTLTFEMLETRDLASRRALNQWHRYTRDDSSLGTFHSEYTTTAELQLYNDHDEVVQTYRLHKCWLADFQESGLDGSSSAAVTVSGTLRYFRWEQI